MIKIFGLKRFVEKKERSNLVIEAKEVKIIKEVMACDVSPLAMFCKGRLSYRKEEMVLGLAVSGKWGGKTEEVEGWANQDMTAEPSV